MGAKVPVVMDGERVFGSQTEAARWLSEHEGAMADPEGVSRCVRGLNRTYLGHAFAVHDPSAARVAELERELAGCRERLARAEAALAGMGAGAAE